MAKAKSEVTQLDTIKKAEFYKQYRNPQHMGNVSQVCETIGINRQTYYNWMKEDEGFKELIEEAKSEMCDIAESTLYSRGLEKDTTALIFWLKNRHPDFKENTAMVAIQQNFNVTSKNDKDSYGI